MMEMILQNKDSTSGVIQFVLALTTVAVMAASLSGFTIKKMIQLMLSR